MTERIAELNTMIKEENLSWTAGLTSISDLTPEAFNHRLGAVPSNDTLVIQTLALPEISAESLPSYSMLQKELE